MCMVWPAAVAMYHSAEAERGAAYQKKVLAAWPEAQREELAAGPVARAGIETLGQGRDGSSLPRRVPTFKNNNGGNPVIPASLFQIVETALQAGHNPVELVRGKLALQVNVFEHSEQVLILRRAWSNRPAEE